ncbi:MAG TPA: PAS domain-containing protein [Catenuloplanes sp.]
MTHVELSLSEAFVPQPRSPAATPLDSNVERWTATVDRAAEPCVVIDRDATILAISASCCALLGLDPPAATLGKPLIDGPLRFIDFTAGRCQLPEADAEKIPPMLALSSERLARGLIRVQFDAGTGGDVTVDAISTPLVDDGVVRASLTFFSAV